MNTLEYENYHEVKDHYESEFSYNTYLCSIPLDFLQVPLHWHNEMELIYVKKGVAAISIDMNDYIVSAGSIALVFPGQIHGIIQAKDTSSSFEQLEYENIIFNLNMLIPNQGDDLTKTFFKKILDSYYTFPAIISPDKELNKTIIACVDRADMICREFPDGYNLAIRSCLYDFFFNINKIHAISSSNQTHNTSIEFLDRIKTITKYIEQHYNEDISIQKMADICNISHSHFMKFFKSYMGTSFVNYLNDYRLLVASRLLTTSDASITEIASKCGFDNVSYFNRMFKKKYNQTPKQIRKRT